MSVEAPERIWVWLPLIDEMGSAVNTIQQPDHVEYVRADKLEELAAENERLLKALETLEKIESCACEGLELGETRTALITIKYAARDALPPHGGGNVGS